MKGNSPLVVGLVATHGQQLRRFLLARVRNTADVPDIMQDIYLRMLRVSHADTIRSPEAYLFTVAQNVLQEYSLRQAKVGPQLEVANTLVVLPAEPEADPVLQLAAQQCLEDLQNALDDFSPKMRATFLFYRRDGLSIEEIATRLGISRPMVKKHLVKALLRFRIKLGMTDQGIAWRRK